MTLGQADLTRRYQVGELRKPEFIDAMNLCHASWFEYADYLRGSEVAMFQGRVGVDLVAGFAEPLDPENRSGRMDVIEQRRRSGKALVPHQLLIVNSAVRLSKGDMALSRHRP